MGALQYESKMIFNGEEPTHTANKRQQVIGAEFGSGQPDMPAAYDPALGIHRIPGFPEERRRQIPFADGRPGFRGQDRPYNLEYENNKIRARLIVQSDKINQFAELVTGFAAKPKDSAWEGGGRGGASMMALLLDNVLQGEVARTQGGSVGMNLLAPDHHAEMVSQLKRAVDVGNAELARHLQTLQNVPAQPTAQATAKGQQQQQPRPPTTLLDPNDLANDPYFQREAAQMQWGMGSAAKPPAVPVAVAKGVPPPPGPAPVLGPPRAIIPGGAGPVDLSAIEPVRPPPAHVPLQRVVDRPMDRTPLSQRDAAAKEAVDPRSTKVQEARDALRRREEEVARMTATDQPLATVDSEGRIIYGVQDKWSMLLYLIKNKGSDTQFKMWRTMYNVPEVVDRVSGKPQQDWLSTPDGRRRYYENLLALQKMLYSGEGTVEWVEAPEHIGYMFFTPAFTAALQAATWQVHNVCDKHWALEIDLMTHDAVRVPFARLVASFLVENQSGRLLRMTQTASAARDDKRHRKMLLMQFKKLVQSSGQLRFDGQGSVAEDRKRKADNQQRGSYLEMTGQYYLGDR